MTGNQRRLKAIEKIEDGETTVVIHDLYLGDVIRVKRKDIKRFSYPEFSDKGYIDFVLPTIKRTDGTEAEIIYHSYSNRQKVFKSGDLLYNFAVDKDVIFEIEE